MRSQWGQSVLPPTSRKRRRRTSRTSSKSTGLARVALASSTHIAWHCRHACTFASSWSAYNDYIDMSKYCSEMKRKKQATRQCAFRMPTWQQRGRLKKPMPHHFLPGQFQTRNSHVACRCKPPALSLLESILAHSGLAICRYTVSIESTDHARAVSHSHNTYTYSNASGLAWQAEKSKVRRAVQAVYGLGKSSGPISHPSLPW